MRSIVLAALLVLGMGSPATARDFTTVCDDFYPEIEDPEHTVAIAELKQDQFGVYGLSCRLATGDLLEACDINDGICCGCNVARGFTPECTITLVVSESSTHGSCISRYPACYYGDSCEEPWVMASTTEATPGVIKRKKRKGKGKGTVKTTFINAPAPVPTDDPTVTTTTTLPSGPQGPRGPQGPKTPR